MAGVFMLRSGAVLIGAAFFGVAVAVFLAWGLLSLAALSAAFLVFFTLGAGYRVLAGAILRDGRVSAPASWAGGLAATAVLAGGLALALRYAAGDGLVILVAYGAAINLAFIPAKLACREAGCCGARLRFGQADLRLVEIAATTWILVAMALLWHAEAARAAALVGLGGHLAVRLASYLVRGWLPARPSALATHMQDIVPLAILGLLASVL